MILGYVRIYYIMYVWQDYLNSRYVSGMGRRPTANLPPELANLIKQIGVNLTELRQARGLTQTDLAKRAKVSITTLNEIESRRFRDIRLSTLTALAVALSVPVPRLFQDSDVKLESKDKARLLKASEDLAKIVRRLSDRD